MSDVALSGDMYGLPVSTTHMLSSGVAGTMAAGGSDPQWPTARDLLVASILLASGLYYVFTKVF
jgi:PiT family inorganic phosphate transporter